MTPPTRSAPLRPFLAALAVLAAVVVAVVVVAGRSGGRRPDVARTAYTASELESAVEFEVYHRCLHHGLSVCSLLESAARYRTAGNRSQPAPSMPTARCRDGVDTASPSTTCALSASNGMSAGPVRVILVVQERTGGLLGPDETVSFISVS